MGLRMRSRSTPTTLNPGYYFPSVDVLVETLHT